MAIETFALVVTIHLLTEAIVFVAAVVATATVVDRRAVASYMTC